MSLTVPTGRLFDRARTLVAEGLVPCAVVGLARHDRLLDLLAVPDPDGRFPVTPESQFLVASVTKPVVATAIMRLVEEGRLLLGDPVARYLPEFARHGKETVTTWHLLTHTSGLDEGYVQRLTETGGGPAEHIAGALDSFLRFPPGSRFQYNNAAFWVLAALLERLAGLPYPEVLQRVLFTPLAMRATGFVPDPERAVPVLNFPWPERFADFVRLQHPAGGLFSTAADLLRFGQLFLNRGTLDGHRLLSPATVRLMTRLHLETTYEWEPGRPQTVRWALGWSKGNPDHDLVSPEGFGHAGATGTLLWVDPAFDLVFVFLTNHWGNDQRAARLLLNAALAASEE